MCGRAEWGIVVMDTQEARTQVLEIVNDALLIVDRLEAGESPTREDKQRLRQLVADARAVLPDAGYPAEVAWQGLQRASIGVDTIFEQADQVYWQAAGIDLRAAVQTLEPLVSPRFKREADFPIVG
jgi:hypothetical protein